VRHVAVRAMIVAVVAATFVAGCGGGSERKSVASYIEHVNKIEQEMRSPLNDVVRTYARFSTKQKLQTLAPRLERARTVLKTLDRRLAKLDAPPAARKLHRLLLQLVGAEIGLAGEIQRLAVFLPAFDAVLTNVGPANTRLALALSASPTPKPKTVRGTRAQIVAAQADYKRQFARAASAQAAAIEAYRDELAPLIRELRLLDPPAVLEPSLRSEIAMLTKLRSSGEALADALRTGRYSEVPALNRRFVVAARTSRTVSAQQAQIEAIRRYNARIRALNALTAGIQREQVNLERTLR
jgi:hypothetical protein